MRAAPKTGAFADIVDFPSVYQGLEQRGIYLSAEKKKKFEEIALNEFRKTTGEVSSNDFGTILTNLVYRFWGLIQNLISSDKDTKYVDTGSQTLEQARMDQLYTATGNIYRHLTDEGGELAQVAELLTGQHPKNSTQPLAQTKMDPSLYDQLAKSINFPKDVTTSLNDRRPYSPPPVAKNGTGTITLT